MWPWCRARTPTTNEHESRFLLELASIDLRDWEIRHKNPHNTDVSLSDPPEYYMLVFERDGCSLRFYRNAETQVCRVVVNDEDVYVGKDRRLIELWDRIFSFAKLSETERKYARAAQAVRQARESPRVQLHPE